MNIKRRLNYRPKRVVSRSSTPSRTIFWGGRYQDAFVTYTDVKWVNI